MTHTLARAGLVAAALLTAACGPKTEYTKTNPINLVNPPAWVAHPFAQDKDGNVFVVGRSSAENAMLGESQAEMDARVRLGNVLASTMESLSQRDGTTKGSRGGYVQDEASATRAKASIAGAMPVEIYYDKQSKIQYALLKMDGDRWRALFDKYDPTVAQKTMSDLGSKLNP